MPGVEHRTSRLVDAARRMRTRGAPDLDIPPSGSGLAARVRLPRKGRGGSDPHGPGAGLKRSRERRYASTSSGHGTMVDFTVFMAMASATACDTPSSVNG